MDVSDADRALAFANIEKAANYYGVKLAETPMFTIRKHCKNRHPSEGAGQIRQAVAF
jgi:hypothetical protein